MTTLRRRMHEIIFEADTPAGRAFDVALLLAIGLSVTVVLLESVAEVRAAYGRELRLLEWAFTLAFTVEYVLRLLSVDRPWLYARSFLGVIDLLAVVPTYLTLLVPDVQALMVIRALRLLRVFRVFGLARYLGEARLLGLALRQSRRRVVVFAATVANVVLIGGALIYVVEGEAHGFTSIPLAAYWAIVTMTTVGYGDLVPGTLFGRFLAASLMLLGYSLIVVPTGIVSVELARAVRQPVSTQACPNCSLEGHDADARHCKYCGARL
jgi:voltage-gated potassium channel